MSNRQGISISETDCRVSAGVGGTRSTGDDGPGAHPCPLLVNNGQSGTQKRVKEPWSRKQKRIYRTIMSWMNLKRGQGYQLFRCDTTSIKGRDVELTVAFKKLRRKVESVFGVEIEFFKIETAEGYGVLHMIWAIKSPHAVWFPQKWLSATWEEITGASIVWVSRLGASKRKGRKFRKRPMTEHVRKVAQYMAGQYLANQDAIVRISWSWWRNSIRINEAFKSFYNGITRGRYVRGEGLVHGFKTLHRWEAYEGWNEVLSSGGWISPDLRYFYLEGNTVKVQYPEYI